MTCPVCGHADKAGGKPRSVDQIRRYFSVLKAARFHWPETHPVQFASDEEFRSWVQMKAGAREVGASIPLSGMSKERAMLLAEAAIRGAGSYAWPVLHGDMLVIFRPKSISFAKMAHADFCKLASDVEDVIRAEAGLDPEALLREKAA